MEINIFILCYNEEVLIPQTIKHYKHFLPNCKITILDNHSTDKSVDIAKQNGCDIISWGEVEEIDDYRYTDLKNNVWKKIKNGWIIVCDMDEWLCVTIDELKEETVNKTTFLDTHGYHMVSDSKCPILSDINLHQINEGVYWRFKPMCFFRPDIKETQFSVGTFTYKTKGNFKLSSKRYFFKHMGGHMGFDFYKNKTINRFLRKKNRTPANHYTDKIHRIKRVHNEMVTNKKKIGFFDNFLIEIKRNA